MKYNWVPLTTTSSCFLLPRLCSFTSSLDSAFFPTFDGLAVSFAWKGLKALGLTLVKWKCLSISAEALTLKVTQGDFLCAWGPRVTVASSQICVCERKLHYSQLLQSPSTFHPGCFSTDRQYQTQPHARAHTESNTVYLTNELELFREEWECFVLVGRWISGFIYLPSRQTAAKNFRVVKTSKDSSTSPASLFPSPSPSSSWMQPVPLSVRSTCLSICPSVCPQTCFLNSTPPPDE